jgi:PPM family protein phosphatase
MQPRADQAETDTAEYLTFDEMAARFYEDEPRTTTQADFGARTHPGMVRETNEDQYLVTRRRRVRDVILTSLARELLRQPEQSAYTLCVADGMGGHAFGEMASFLALRTGWELGAGEVKWSVKMNDRETKEMMKKADVFFRLIDQSLRDIGEEQPRLRNMGTTLTVCYVTGPELFVIHAGDSRAYMYRDGALSRLTHDHTLAQSMIDAGLVVEGSPEERRRRHILTNCIGGPDLALDVDVDHHRLRTGDRLLLCTDGLTKHLDDPEIVALLERHPVPEDACRAMVDLALERGGKDNVTVVLGHFAFPGPAEEFPDE